MFELKTSSRLLDALRRTSRRELTASEVHRQRVSFIMGSLKDNSGVTRARVEEVLARQDGHSKFDTV